ncbi:MAG: hypothetical protein MHM6MM_001564 [Cercozoa sp. M6MM]
MSLDGSFEHLASCECNGRASSCDTFGACRCESRFLGVHCEIDAVNVTRVIAPGIDESDLPTLTTAAVSASCGGCNGRGLCLPSLFRPTIQASNASEITNPQLASFFECRCFAGYSGERCEIEECDSDTLVLRSGVFLALPAAYAANPTEEAQVLCNDRSVATFRCLRNRATRVFEWVPTQRSRHATCGRDRCTVRADCPLPDVHLCNAADQTCR